MMPVDDGDTGGDGDINNGNGQMVNNQQFLHTTSYDIIIPHTVNKLYKMSAVGLRLNSLYYLYCVTKVISMLVNYVTKTWCDRGYRTHHFLVMSKQEVYGYKHQLSN